LRGLAPLLDKMLSEGTDVMTADFQFPFRCVGDSSTWRSDRFAQASGGP
jgi:hypothetical protein